MAETAKKRTTRPKVEAVPEPAPEAEAAEEHGQASHASGACPVAWCPICMAVTAVQPLRPDVVEHLLKAGSELLLAFKGVLDARAEELNGETPPPAATRLEKIDLG